MLVIFFNKLTKNPSLIFLGVCGGWGWRDCGGEGGVIMFTNVSNGTSTLQGIQMCQIILKYMLEYRRNGPEKLNL